MVFDGIACGCIDWMLQITCLGFIICLFITILFIIFRSIFSLLVRSDLYYFIKNLCKGCSFHFIVFSHITLFIYDLRYEIYIRLHSKSVFIIMDFKYDIIELIFEQVEFILMKVHFDNILNV